MQIFGSARLAISVLALLTALAVAPAAAQSPTKEQIAEIIKGAEAAQELHNQGKHQEAFTRAMAVRQLIRKSAGDNHPNHGLMLVFIGDTASAMGRNADAEKFYREALAIAEKARGASHHEVAAALAAIARLYRKVERFGESEALFKRALAMMEKLRGKDHKDVADYNEGLAKLYEDSGRHREAEQFYQRALTVREIALGPNNTAVANTIEGFAVTKQSLGKYPEAEALYKRALAIHEKVDGAETENVASAVHNLSDFFRTMGRYEEAEAFGKRALAIRTKVLGPDHVEVGRSTSSLASVLAQSGRYEEAERLYRRALVIREAAYGPEHSEVSLTLNNLAFVYLELGRYEEAEPIYRRSLAIREKALSPGSPLIAEALGNLGVAYRRMGKLDRAEPLQRRALAIREKNLGSEHPDVADSYNNLAVLLGELGRNDEAAKLFRRALVIREKSLGPDHPDTALSLANVASEESKLGKKDEAEKLHRRALAIREKTLGPRHPDVADTLESIALMQVETDRLQDALPTSRRAAKIVIDRLVASSGNGLGLSSEMLSRVLDTNLDLLQRAEQAGLNAPQASQEAFEIVQRANQSSAAAALNQMAARFGAGNDRMAGLVRQQQDAATELQDLNKTLLAEIAKPSNERKLPQEQALRARIVKVEESLTQFNDRLKKEFPRYAELVDPKPLPLKQVQALLGPDEALLVYHLGNRAKFVFAITRERVDWKALTLDTDEIDEKVQTLRDQLDPDAVEQGRMAFDLKSAHELYAATIGPVESTILSKPHLLIVGAGALTSLPFQVLLTQPPAVPDAKTQEHYLGASWLALRHSLTVLPSVGSIQVLREVAARTNAPLPYIGFGDPVFRPGGGATTRAAAKATGKRAARTINYREAFRGSRANTDGLSKALAPLPDTADELRAFAKTLKVPDSALKLGPQASEAMVKSLKLGDYRIVHFATHALVAGEVALFSEQAEPALALTIPKAATSEDDGLLTSSEVAALNLNANWVILSACNTAAGDKPGAEALTGLARAFFYAGARTLLVSHWPVQSAAAVRLTTRTIAILEEKSQLPPAEALRIAMLDLMKDKGDKTNAHPAIWAPFVVVGTTKRGG